MGSGPASAAEFNLTPGEIVIALTPAEAAMIVAGDLGPALGQLPPGFPGDAKLRLGETISRYAARAAADPATVLVFVVEAPFDAPRAVSVAVEPAPAVLQRR